MPKIIWLESAMPLVKTIEQTPAGLISQPYPHALNFTSHAFEAATVADLTKELAAKQKSGMCLLKGTIKKPLKDEPRAGSTTSEAPTDWVCFDLDKAPFDTPQAFMKAIKLDDVSYCVQYSASHGLPGSTGLSCHIFCFLTRPLPAPQLKSWLMYLNFHTEELRNGLRLSRTGIALSYPLDITTCQNDKLLYVCPPKFIGMRDPLKTRVEFVKRKHDEINVEKIALHAPEALKKMAREILNEKRVAAQLPALKSKTTIVGEYEVQNNPGVMTITGGPREERGFVYFNINGGSNWSYFHPVNNFELLHNFKGEPFVRTKDVFPEYYKECVRARSADNASNAEDGDVLLAFRDKRTATYWTGTWNEASRTLDLMFNKSETQVQHFMLSHGRIMGDFIPIWEKIFDPTSPVVVDVDARTVNTYTPSEFMKSAVKIAKPSLAVCPTIHKVIKHVIGDGEVMERFLNWLAVIYQERCKTTTSWVIHGVQGTGKDTLVDRIISPIFSRQYVEVRNQNELNSDFSGWLEYAIVAHVREIEVDALQNGGVVESKLKSYIADTTVPIRKMRTDSYSAPSFVNFLFSSNKSQPVRIPKDDRRFNVGVFQREKIQISLEELEVLIPQELQDFANFLHSYQADRYLASTPVQSDDRDEIIALSMTSIEHTAQYLKDGNLEGMWEAMPDESVFNDTLSMTSVATYANAYIVLMKRCLTDYLEGRESKLTRDELGVIFEYCVGGVPKSPNKLTSFLKHHGLSTERLRIGNHLSYGVAVNWFASDAFIRDVQASLSKEPAKLRSVKK